MNRTKRLKRKSRGAIQDTTTTAPQDKHTVDSEIDIFLIDQSTACIPLLRLLTAHRVDFYCHLWDKLLASSEFVDDLHSAPSTSADEQLPSTRKQSSGFVNSLYRLPMDMPEECTTRKGIVYWRIPNSQ
jgi:hypothetical protein